MADPTYSSLADLGNDIAELLNRYEKDVLGAIKDGVDEAAQVFIRQAEKDSPVDTGEYQKSWDVQPTKKAKYIRYVGNRKKVKAHKADAEPTIPLINILEFSTDRGHPHVKDAIDHSQEQIVSCIAGHIDKKSN